ncbi:MAG: hypothetical protein QOI94_1041 [Acidobacteriaceae bacterium]|nr:hypothetical protein [Acidobacteriaceae bacterium]
MSWKKLLQSDKFIDTRPAFRNSPKSADLQLVALRTRRSRRSLKIATYNAASDTEDGNRLCRMQSRKRAKPS